MNAVAYGSIFGIAPVSCAFVNFALHAGAARYRCTLALVRRACQCLYSNKALPLILSNVAFNLKTINILTRSKFCIITWI